MGRIVLLGLLTVAFFLQSNLASGCNGNPPSLPHGSYQSLPASGYVRARAVYECNNGYFLAGPAKRRLAVNTFMRECIRGSWGRPKGVPSRPLCLLKSKCHTKPRAPSNGRMSGHCCDDMDTLTFSCNRGYTLAGSERLQCSEGRWNGSIPECTRGPVCVSQEKPNGHVVSRRSGRTHLPNDVIKYECDDDYYFEKKVETEGDYGSYVYGDEVQSNYADPGASFTIYDYAPRSIKCLRNGNWNTTFQECNAFTCEHPPALRNGAIDLKGSQGSQYNGGRIISYACNKGFILVGPSFRRCSMKRGGWTGNDPRCHQIRCPRPVAPENGYIDNKRLNKEGDTIRIFCSHGYELRGSSNMTCGPFADWSGTTPMCHKANLGNGKCQSPVIPFGGRKIGVNRYHHNVVVQYTCYGNNRLIGPNSTRCTSGGWVPRRQPHCQVPFSYDNPTELAKKFTRVFDKLEETNNEILEKTGKGERGRFLDINSKTGLDIYFLIDSSASVTEAHFKKALGFVKALVSKVGVTNSATGARIGVTTFSDNIVKQFGDNNGFHTSSKASLEMIVDLLDRLKWSQGGTNIRGALEFVERMMLPMSLSSRSGAKQYLFLLSDGDDNMGGDPIPVAKRLKAPKDKSLPSMEIFCVKIGLEDNAETKVENERKLRMISSEDELNADGTDPHFFRLRNFPAFDILVKLIVNRTANYSECGIAGVRTDISTANIINGQVAPPHAWPWMASISIMKPNERGHNAFKHVCGGTLIRSQWILTAAHCFQGEMYERSLDRIRVKLGFNQWKLDEAGTGESEVLSMHIHRGWQVNATKHHPPRTSWANDIALLRLKESVRLTNKTRTICLANPSQEHDKFSSGGLMGVVAGWGFSENRTVAQWEEVSKTSDNLRHLKLPVVQKNASDGFCRPPAQEKVVCAGSSRMEDACTGDSGGPLMVWADVGAGERRWYEIGIVSYGSGCALGNNAQYGRYTEVRQYNDWIEGTIKTATEQANP